MLKFRDESDAPINNKYKPDENIQFDRKMVYKRYQEMKNGRVINGQNIEELWDKWEKQYEAWRPDRSADDWQSNIVPPFTTTIVERILAETVDQTVWPTIKARGTEDVAKAKLLTHIKDYTWEVGDGDLELYAGLKQLTVLGKTIWQEDYWQDKRQVKVMKKFNPETNEEEYVEKEIFDFDDVYGETVNIRNFFIDPMAKTINRGRFKANDCIRRYIMNYDTFMESFKDSVYDQFGAVQYVRPGGDTNYYQFYTPPEGINKDDQVEVLFYWGRRPDKLIIVANDVVIRDGPNPYNHKQLPFAEGSDIPRLNGFWANGEPKLLESIQDELTTLRRMRVDRQHMDLFKMFLVSNRENLDEDEALVAPSRFLYVDDPNNSIKSVEYRDINPSAYKEEELLRRDGREVTGVESPQSSGTATEAAIFKESTMKSLKLKIWLLSRELLTGIARLRVPNIVQYYSLPKATQIVGGKTEALYRQIVTADVALEVTREGQLVEKSQKGDNFFIVKPEMIAPNYGAYDLKMGGEPSFPVSKPLQQQMTREFMQHPVFVAAMESGYYDVGKAADVLSETMEFDPDEFKSVPAQAEGGPQVDQEQLLELANRENEAIASGKRIEPTAFSTREHTNIHLAFMGSPEFQKNALKPTEGVNPQTGQPNKVIDNMTYHILGEEAAQNMRGQEGGTTGPGTPPAQPKTVAQGVRESEAQAAMPGRMVGDSGMS